MGSKELTITDAERRAYCALVDDWEEQVKMKCRLDCEAAEEEWMWDYLSSLDICQKGQLEEAFKKQQRERALEAQNDLIEQMKEKVVKSQIEKKIKAKELTLIMQDAQMAKDNAIKVAEAKALERKKNKEHVRSMLDLMVARNVYREKRTKREELAGLEFIKQALKSLIHEQQNKRDQRAENKRSIAIYLEYLKKRGILLREKDSEIEKIIDQVVQEQYNKTMAIRYKDAQQRRVLKESVLEGRAQQRKDREEEKKRLQAETLEEFQNDQIAWRQHLKDMELEKCKHQLKQQQYKLDLDAQVAYQKKLKEREMNEAVRAGEMCVIEDRLFKNIKENEVLKTENPYRTLIKGKPVQQALMPVPDSCKMPFSYCCPNHNTLAS